MEQKNYVYNEKFVENILIFGQTGCGKTTFVQKLAINNHFSELQMVERISEI